MSTQTKDINNLPSSLPIPRDGYATRVRKADMTTSKAGNLQIVIEVEIYSPATVTISGSEYNVAGKWSKEYLPLTEKGWWKTEETMRKLGLNPASLDKQNPDTDQFVGKTCHAIWESEEWVERKDLSPEQVAAGMKPEEADPIKDGDGNAIKGYRTVLAKIVGKTGVPAPVF